MKVSFFGKIIGLIVRKGRDEMLKKLLEMLFDSREFSEYDCVNQLISLQLNGYLSEEVSVSGFTLDEEVMDYDHRICQK